MMEVLTVEQAKEHILEIRRKRGVDESSGISENWTLEDLSSTLKLLSQELNDRQSHFLYELVQNADDNTYAVETPCLRLSSSGNLLICYCNEVGFKRNQVEAICRIGRSTKRKNKAYSIGEKGVGFKSVFMVASVVTIKSGPYSFCFDTRPPLGDHGMVIPSWVEHIHSHDGTKMFLTLKAEVKSGLLDEIAAIDCAFLLFLRKLRRIVMLSNEAICERFHDEEGERAVLTTSKKKLEYKVVRQIVRDMPKETKRDNVSESEIILAFPFADGKPFIKSCDTFAFLPIRSFGFTFLIHGDFLVTASRESIQEQPAWNRRLRDHIFEAFKIAVHSLARSTRADRSLYWPQYLECLPGLAPSFLEPVAKDIVRKLSKEKLVLSEKGILEAPADLKIVPLAYRQKDQSLLLDYEGMRAQSVHRYPQEAYPGLKILGVSFMTFDEFLQHFKSFVLFNDSNDFRQKPLEWHSAISDVLLSEINNRTRWYPTPSALVKLGLLGYKIIPLTDGTWVSADDGTAYINHSDDGMGQNIPDGIKMKFIDANATSDARRREFFEQLGSKTCNTLQVCKVILESHNTGNFTLPVLISHAVYMFKVKYEPKPEERLGFVMANGKWRKQPTIYLDFGQAGNDIARLLHSDNTLLDRLHPDYRTAVAGEESEAWGIWLLSWSMIQCVPPLYLNGKLAPYYEYLLCQSSKEFLGLLKKYWATYKGALSKEDDALRIRIAEIFVSVDGGRVARLKDTILPRLRGKTPGNWHFLDLDDPSDRAWDFLATFGVATLVDYRYHLQRLKYYRSHMSEPLVEHVATLYGNLEKRISGNEMMILDCFENESLIYTGTEWVKPSQCVWKAIFDCTIAPVLFQIYKDYSQLFQNCLKMKDAGIEEITSEIMKLNDDKVDIARKKQLVFALNDLLQNPRLSKQQTRNCKDSLMENSFIPVNNIGDLELSSPKNGIWIADHSVLHRIFQGIIPLMDFSLQELSRLKSVIEVFDLWLLSDKVEEERILSDDKIQDEMLTRKLRLKVPWIRNLLLKGPEASSNISEKMQKLENLSAYGVSSVTLRRHIYEEHVGIVYGRDDDGKVVLQEVENGLEIYVKLSDLRSSKFSYVFKSKLGEFCGLDAAGRELLNHILDMESDEEIREMLEERRIEIVPAPIIEYPPKDVEEDYDAQVPSSLVTTAGSDGSSQQRTVPDRLQDDAPPHQGGSRIPKARFSGLELNHKDPGSLEQASALTRSETPTVSATMPATDRPAKRVTQEDLHSVEEAAKALGGNNLTMSFSSELHTIHSATGLSTEMGAQDIAHGGHRVTRSSPETKKQHSFSLDMSSLADALPGTPCGSPAAVSSGHSSSTPTSIATTSFETGRNSSSTRLATSPPVKSGLYFAPTLSHISADLSANDAAENHKVGLLGEVFVFHFLTKILGPGFTFNMQNWTSRYREKAGFPPFEEREKDYSDFTYEDVDGKLSQYFTTQGCQIAWEHSERPPVYHLEVKSTRGPLEEPFYMSNNQVDMARRWSLSMAGRGVPHDAYIVLRVYDLEERTGSSATKLHAYVDPWGLYLSSKLKLMARNEYLVTPAAYSLES